MPPPSALKRKILLKNKRLKLDVEKTELELYLKGEFTVILFLIAKLLYNLKCLSVSYVQLEFTWSDCLATKAKIKALI